MVEQYEVYWVELDPTRGGEMAKTRPCVVVTGLRRRLLFQLLDKLRWVHAARYADEMLHGLTVQLSLFPLELGNDLILSLIHI